MTTADLVSALFVTGIILAIVWALCFFITTNKIYPKEFKIVLSEGAYDIMLGSRRLTTKPTFEEAKQWLDEHKDDYRKKDKVLYREKL